MGSYPPAPFGNREGGKRSVIPDRVPRSCRWIPVQGFSGGQMLSGLWETGSAPAPRGHRPLPGPLTSAILLCTPPARGCGSLLPEN